MTVLRTMRLLLRPWRDEDVAAFAAMSADPRVMAHYPKLLSASEAEGFAVRVRSAMAMQGFGLWAVEAPGVAPFVGYVGLARPGWEAHFTPCVEVGWRLGFEFWGRSFAFEAASAVVQFGFERAGLAEIVSFTTPENERSWRLMERLGMRRSAADDFDHPRLPPGHRLRRHVLYRLRRVYFP